jgi:hypothetical protein
MPETVVTILPPRPFVERATRTIPSLAFAASASSRAAIRARAPLPRQSQTETRRPQAGQIRPASLE